MSTVAEAVRAVDEAQLKRAARMAKAVEHIDAAQRQQVAKVEPSQKRIRSWYNSWEWKRCRYNWILNNKERKCACCNSTPAHGERMVVAHIKPIRKYWQLRAQPDNLMWLCDSCNRGMGSHDETDWRSNISASEAATCA